tara:strand:- start:1256 stop:5626 length:4371 start_codon:yes stop_codon:yes gene_type:complete
MAVDNTILVRRGSGIPTYSDFTEYELAYDYSANKLYIRDGNEMVEIGGSGASTSGSNNQILTDDGSGGINSEGSLEFAGQFLTIKGNDPSNTYGVKEKLRIHRGGNNTDRQLQIYEMRHSGGREFLQAFNLDITTDNSSGYTYTQGNYGGSSYIEFDNLGALKFYNDSGVANGSRNAITPSLSMWIRDNNTILMPGKLGVGWSAGAPSRALDVQGGIELSANDNTLDTNNFTLRRDSSGGGNIDVPGDMTINLDTNNNQTNAVFEICANGSSTGVFKVGETGTVTTGTWQGSAVGLAYGGTGASSASGARSNLGIVSGHLATAAVSDGASTLATGDQIYDHVTTRISGKADTSSLGDLALLDDIAASRVVSGTFSTARIPNLSASKITSGTFDSARMPASFAADSVTKDDVTTRTESGFYQTSTGTTGEGYPITNNSYQHLLAVTHSNNNNYYSMQIAGSFYDQNFYGRKTNGSGTTSWVRFITTADEGSGNGFDADTLDGIQGSSFLRSDANDTWSGNISTTSTNGIRFGNANQTDGNDGFIAAGRFASGLNIVGTQTSSGTGRQVRVYGDLIDSAGVAYIKTNSSLNGSNISSGTVAAARIANLAATKITSGTLNNARLNTDMELSAAAPRYKLTESDVTNTPTWWMVADGGNYSIRLNNTGTYPLVITTDSDNDAVESISLGYNTSVNGKITVSSSIDTTGDLILRRAGSNHDRITIEASEHKFIIDAVERLSLTSSGATVTGNIAVSGTVDGRNIANDGSKLDGIESGATADQTASEILTLIKTVDGSGSGLSADNVDGYDSSRFFRRQGSASATVGPGWMTVATNTSGRKAGEILVTDADSGDHAFIRIHWLRSYVDSNFTVINCGGHGNAITGVRVLGQDNAGSNEHVYGEKILQVYVDRSSSYDVKIFRMGDDAHYSDHTVHTPTIENSITGYSLNGNQLEDLNTYGFAHEEGIYAGGALKAGGSLSVSGTSEFTEQITLNSSDSGEKLFFQFNGTTVGDIGGQDTTWLRLNQSTNKNIYTPRYIRADNGFFVDGSSQGITGNGTLRVPGGSASAPSMSFSVDTDTGMYKYDANSLGFSVGGAVRATINSSGVLYVTSKVQAGNSGVEIWDGTHGFKQVLGKDSTYTFLKNNDGNVNIHLGDSGDGNNYYNSGGHRFRSMDGGTYFAAINSTGLRIGTGGSFASTRLDVQGTSRFTGEMYINHGGSDYAPGISFMGGTNTPGSATYENAQLAYYDASGTGYFRSRIGRYGGDFRWVIGDSGGDVECARISKTGLRVPDGSAAAPSISFIGDGDLGFYRSAANTIRFTAGNSIRGTWNGDGLVINGSSLGVNVAVDTTDGVIRAGNDVIAYYSSDERLKENVKPIDNALDKVSKIRGVEFDWIVDKEIHPNEGHDVGVIAQEIEKVLPEVVETRDSGYKAVKYEKIVSLLIEAVNEQQQQINELKEKLNG